MSDWSMDPEAKGIWIISPVISCPECGHHDITRNPASAFGIEYTEAYCEYCHTWWNESEIYQSEEDES